MERCGALFNSIPLVTLCFKKKLILFDYTEKSLVIEGFFDEISSKNHILFVLNELHHFKENL
jgi:hypothetical protein